MPDSSYLTLQEVLSSLLADVEFPAIADNIVISGYGYEVHDNGVYWAFAVGTSEEIVLSLPGLDDFGIVIRDLGRVDFFVGERPFIKLQSAGFAIRLPRALFKPVAKDSSGEPVQNDDGSWKLETDGGEPIPREISVDLSVAITLDSEGNLALDLPFEDGTSPGFTLEPVMIGDTNIVITVANLSFSFSGNQKGISFDSAAIYLPPDLPAAPDLKITHCFIGQNGFSGQVSAEWDLEFDQDTATFEGELAGELFGFKGGLRRVALEFQENLPVSSDIQGQMLIPYFEGAVDVRVDIHSTGDFSITLLSLDEEGITLTKEELLALNIKSLAVTKREDNVGEVVLSGGLEPLLMASDGLKWPRLDVKDLYIDTTGKFRIAEAWLDLKELATLDLWGFHLELNRIGLGYQETDDKLWIDLSGSLRLIEQIPVGLGVEGFRLTWPRTLFEQLSIEGPPTLDQALAIAGELEVKFDGVYLFFGVPDAVEFEGLIRFFKEAQTVGFAGDMALRVPASGFGAEAGLLIGMNLEPPPYPFLYVYFGVDLPAGIPLGQSGLALKGAQGMFGLNVAPDKAPEENWYYDWYKRGPIVGAHPTNKWTNWRDALALGVGVTITTADGYVKGTRGLLVLSIPGPILIIEGRALILNGLQPNAEPPLRALAVFDGIAGTAQFNIEAEATLIKDMLEAYGMLEAFFDFNDLTNWHLYLGQDEPPDRRIRASVLKFNDAFLFKADAYLMMDMVGAGTLRSRMGVFIGFNPPIPDVGPLIIDFDATLEGDGVVTVRPDQFSGDIDMSANIGLSAFGFSVQLSASAGVLTEGPEPFKVGANVHVEAEMPAPLDPVEADLEFIWESLTAPQIESPLSEITVNSRFLPSGGGFRADPNEEKYRIHDISSASDSDALRSQWQSLAEKSPPVPVDSQPIIAFNHEMNSAFFARHPNGTDKHYDLGPIRFTPTLTTVKLYEHLKEDDDTWQGDDSDWILIASSDANDDKPLPGVWLAESDPQSPDAPSARRAQLWTDNPSIHTGRALGAGHLQFLGSIKEGKPLAGRVLDDYPDLMKCQYTEAKAVCVDFKSAAGAVIEPGKEWEREGLRFGVTSGQARVQSVTETVRVPTPKLGDTPRIATKNPLASWDARISGWLNSLLRRYLPGLNWLWDRLFGHKITRTCLFVDGDLDICFPRSVGQVWIKLCQPAKVPPSEIPARFQVSRAPRTRAELDEVREDARRKKTKPDLRACVKGVQASFTISDREWLIEASEGFDCLDIVGMKGFAIAEICYVTTEEQERAERAERQCETNANPPGDGQTLRPGAYYRLDVVTKVEGKLPEDYTGPYESVDTTSKTFNQVIFFQTESPPANLRPYVKWSSPLHQADRVFYEDDIAIRFLRSNVEEMFSAPYKLETQIVDAQGKLVEGYATEWLKSGSATLFAEEQVWQEHRSSLGWPPAPVRNDDILIATRNWESEIERLRPNARYEVQVIRTDHLVKPDDKPLFSSTFTTSKFASFEALVGSYSGQALSISAKDQHQESLSMIPALLASTGALARAEWEWQRAQVDYRFEILKGGREGLEQARLKRRQARATHDATFRALAESLADVYFQPFAERLEVYVLKDANTARAVCLWIRSPESLDLRMDVPEDPEDEPSHPPDYVGRTEVHLQRQGSTVPSPKIMLHNADSTQLLLFPPSNTSWVSGPHRLEFTYRRDYGDELRNIDHRYDRPREFRHGRPDPEEHTVEFVL